MPRLIVNGIDYPKRSKVLDERGISVWGREVAVMTWEREEWLAARAADPSRPHPLDCRCLECACEEVGE